jgi:hypothetical protein
MSQIFRKEQFTQEETTRAQKHQDKTIEVSSRKQPQPHPNMMTSSGDFDMKDPIRLSAVLGMENLFANHLLYVFRWKA